MAKNRVTKNAAINLCELCDHGLTDGKMGICYVGGWSSCGGDKFKNDTLDVALIAVSQAKKGRRVEQCLEVIEEAIDRHINTLKDRKPISQ